VRPAVQRVAEALARHGVEAEIREFAESTRTAAEAAAAIGTTVPRIVKSLVFLADDQPILVLASGGNRVDTGKLERLTGKTIRRADAERVRAETGFSIGGVPPVGHPGALPVYVDEDLLQYDVVWAAAGTPYAVFPIAPQRLVEISGGTPVDLKEAR
jgi:prolyl-tRNA editing enzyme YbaK/EbsC (Cys-tRNA(Pro) deacylase)